MFENRWKLCSRQTAYTYINIINICLYAHVNAKNISKVKSFLCAYHEIYYILYRISRIARAQGPIHGWWMTGLLTRSWWELLLYWQFQREEKRYDVKVFILVKQTKQQSLIMFRLFDIYFTKIMYELLV